LASSDLHHYKIVAALNESRASSLSRKGFAGRSDEADRKFFAVNSTGVDGWNTKAPKLGK
jgi:hypothetical protein